MASEATANAIAEEEATPVNRVMTLGTKAATTEIAETIVEVTVGVQQEVAEVTGPLQDFLAWQSKECQMANRI